MPEGISEIVFVLVALAAWAIKAALERKEAQRSRTQRPAPGGRTSPGRPKADTGEVDIVVGRQPLPPDVAPRPRTRGRQTGAATPLQTSPQMEPAGRRRRGRGRRNLGQLLSPTVSTDDVGDLEDRHLKPKVESHRAPLSEATSIPGARRSGRGRASRRALARLGVAGLASPRQMVRAGVLWSEVLGMPRAMQGPHRSPAAKRASGG